MRPEKRVRNWDSVSGCGAGVRRQLVAGSVMFGITLLAIWLVLADGGRPIATTKSAGLLAPRLQATELYGRLPMRFEAHPAVAQASLPGRPATQQRFFSQGPGYTLLLNNGGEAVLSLEAPAPGADHPRAGARGGAPDRLCLRFVGATQAAVASGVEELPGKSNYYLGNDPAAWVTGVPGYAKVKYRGLYPGIDLVYYGNQRQLEYDLVAAPGANPASIRLHAEGASALRIDPEGHLLLEPANRPGALVRFQKPAVYQEIAGQRRPVPGSYVLRGQREIGFRIGAYDARRPLVIDPVLIYSSYFGGNAHDFAYAVAVDARGQVSVAGTTASSNLPVLNPLATSGAIFVSKFNAAGSALIYSTYLSGSAASAIAIDSAGNAYITGQTSSGFPTTTGALQTIFGGLLDAFVAKLAPDGSLVYSTYLGGSTREAAYGIAVDASGNAYVAGITQSSNFPTVNALQSALANGAGTVFDGFVAKLNAAGSQLLYSTYLGGSGDDRALAIAVDAAGNAYVAGSTSSHDFPLLSAFQSTNADPALCGGLFAACTNGFVSKLSSTGSLVYSTYLGGTSIDVASGIAVDSAGYAYVTGWTDSGDFPTYNPLFSALGNPSGGAFDAFVAKLHSTGTTLEYSTFLGGIQNDLGHAIAVDAAGNAYITGLTQSANFPLQNAIQATPGGGACGLFTPCSDAFVVKLGAGGSALLFSTFLGGNGDDYGNSIALDAAGGIYVAGQTQSGNFPTFNPFQAALVAGTADAFVLKLGEPYPAPAVASLAPNRVGAGGAAFTLTVNGSNFAFPSVVRWNGAAKPTAFVSATQLQAQIGAADIVSAGTVQIDVSTPAPGGGTSTTLPLTIVQPPAVPSGGVLNIARFTAPITAGSEAALFGSNLASTTVSASTLPLPTVLAGTQVTLNGAAVPLFFVSSGQINFQVPWELAGQTQASVVVIATGVSSTPQTVGIGINPGIFTTNSSGSGPGTIMHGADATLVSPSAPARPGETVIISCTGLGPVSNQPASGAAAPSNPPATTTNPVTVTIGGVAATVQYAGLSPGFVAMYQANALVPTSAPLGDTVPVVMTVSGVTSNTVTMAIQPAPNPVPAVSSLNPTSAAVGGPDFPLTVNGSGFISSSVVRFNGVDHTPTAVTSTQLTATVSAAEIASAASVPVQVFNPAPGGGSSNTVTFAVNNPLPSISSVSPLYAIAGGVAFTLTINGSGFVSGTAASQVAWNGNSRTTAYFSSTQLQAAILASDIAAVGTAQVTVFNPAPGGGLSNVAVLNIVTPNPLPVIASINPLDRTAGSGGFPLTVSGLSFVTGATVQWAGSPRPTTYVSGSQLTAQISDADTATPGVFAVTVVNPGPGGGTSAGLPFTIHPAGSYLVGDASPASGNDSGRFGDESLDNLDLILVLRAVTSVPGFVPPNCSDLFDAMDSYPTDGEVRGGDGSLDNLDLIATLRRVTNADPSRPRRTPRGLVCGTMAPGLAAMLARPSELPLGAGAVEFQHERPAEDGAERVAVYLSAYRDLDLGGLSLALGWTDSSPAAQATLRFIPAAAGAPALLDNGLPGTIAAAWLGGLRLRAGQRLLLGFVDLPAAGQPVALPLLYGVKANDRETGRQVPIGGPRSGGTTRSLNLEKGGSQRGPDAIRADRVVG